VNPCRPRRYDTIPASPRHAPGHDGPGSPGCAHNAGVDFPHGIQARWTMAVIEPFIEHRGERRGFWLRKPRPVGQKILIARKGHVIPEVLQDRIPIFLDFRSAFGTGGHGTTEGCIIAMEKAIRGGERVLDLGTGTGILAVAAHKLGAGHVAAVDIDRGACAETRKNLALNGITGGVVVVEGGIRSVEDRYDVVVANLRTPVLVEILKDMADRLNRDGVAILSGILDREIHPFLSLLEERLFEPPEIMRRQGWMTLVSGKRPPT
jgi:ribosomal protein L11 methyltransferase